jgi:Flp pilus assembly protein TadD
VRRELDRVLSSAGFSKNERLSRFLRFVVERHLEGKDGELKESVVGVEVFGRKPGFDPKIDGIVRTEAVRLRARLDKYYGSEGVGDPLIIEMPKGGYRPVFRERTAAPQGPRADSGLAWRVGAALTALLLAVGIGTTWWWRPTPLLVAVDPTRDHTAGGLRVTTGPRRYEANLEAYADYLRARQIMASFPTQGRPLVEPALDYYEQAIAKDATYAPAYAGIADTYLAVERNIGVAPKLGPDLLARAKTAAARALELDPMLSEAHSAMGSIHAREYAWEQAERSFRRAIHLNQNNASAHLDLGFHVLLMAGRVEEGLDEVRRAVRLDPLSPSVNTEYGRALFWAGRYAAAINQLRDAIALEPSRARAYGLLARALSAQGRTADAVAVFEEAIRRGALLPGLANGELACVAARAGRRDDVVVAMLQRQLTNPVANIAARAHACLGDAPQALEHLERALAAREPNLAEILQAPDLVWMRANPRFASLRQELKLP